MSNYKKKQARTTIIIYQFDLDYSENLKERD